MEIDLPVPDHSTLSRRLSKLTIEIPVKPTTEAIHLVVDSTGVKIYGEGEWKTRMVKFNFIGIGDLRNEISNIMSG
ncbi:MULTISPECIES: transposase [Okeania]|uniref:Transposase DDE domain-containing protein n=1 Tax=Okeania hirsuta TaxID=1458930 RepID=A0A3N6Q1E6_9CYAN|nr:MULTISPECIES: transposase [Okeania]NEP04748.1 hypothetical protein [Okeania sp. SIO4D6]NEP39314.1 hypothetical protein [Okeania sp. SIO2H7]NET13070.1 hypothetical protein [Okeania sp. SIO1H6]NEP70794.1 hypothetical protein [Okeania sp. SIO2G5]NEP93558.1 hypothetical protein [Okeania sp. SIO2F5]